MTYNTKKNPVKYILALPTWGQEYRRSEIEPIEKVNFDLGHPVLFMPCNVQKKLQWFPTVISKWFLWLKW